jgi:hypothetical protein
MLFAMLDFRYYIHLLFTRANPTALRARPA